jgi:hypothetical protein
MIKKLLRYNRGSFLVINLDWKLLKIVIAYFPRSLQLKQKGYENLIKGIVLTNQLAT